MENINWVKDSSSIEKIDTPDGKATIIKQFKNEGLEINRYLLKEGKSFYLKAPQDEHGVKTYMLLSGKIHCSVNANEWPLGDLIVLTHSDEHLYIYVESTADLLVHSFHEEAFEITSKKFKIIHDILLKVQNKDHYTNDHNKRVYQLVRDMGVRLGYDGNALHDLSYAARYHDAGKIFIPDAILNKPAGLTPSEYDVMKTHVELGRELFEQCFEDKIINIMAQHHERLDGSGYPLGLKGTEILEEAKILAIVDSFDAMTSDRVYKKGKSIDEALNELYALCDTHYERKYVDLLKEIIER